MKKFQIVRVDSDSVHKAELQIGANVIDVGVVTGCKDERVPKHAITIDLTAEGDMTISPFTPCYMKSPGSSGWVQLEVGSTVPIHVGDLFSLLSDKHWFKVVRVDATMEDNESGWKRKASEKSTDEPSEKKNRLGGSIEAILSPNGNLDNVPSSIGVDPGQEEFNPLDYEDTVLESTEQTTNDIYGASIPEEGKVVDEALATRPHASSTKSLTESDEPDHSPPSSAAETVEVATEERSAAECAEATSLDEAGKKIKWDCGQHFSDRNEQIAAKSDRILNTKQPTVSTSNTDTAVNVTATVSTPPTRNRCTYGSKCYRKNEEHRAQFSHPGDSDYAVLDDRPECRYGVRCYRKNPQHRKDFKHTIQRRRRPQTPIRAKTPETTSATDQSSLEESIDESEYEPSFCTDSSDEAKSDCDDK
ncbi:aprataxin and PNK-like factor [Diprion similis]|uniref:aprataxin and PNK-like factor n=1 Tax=Diprion similis TaxID=362088 RepID=UPI001EF885BB|nr:aprataxin and PNK-like factor [Diprion similis]